jgi:thiol-disulfide isomerase/thioredoxin
VTRAFARAVPAALVAALAFGALAPDRVARADEPAPAARERTLRDVRGRTLDLDALLARGPVLLDFWATWCKPCIASLPEIEKLHRAWEARGLTVIGVSVDGPRNFPKVRPFATRLGLSYPIVLDEDGSLQRRHRVQAIPTAVLLARDGSVALVKLGYRPGETAALERAVAELVGSVSPDSAR